MLIPVAVFGFCVACLLSLALTPVVRRLALRRSLKEPAGSTKIHPSPLPHVGGLAIYGAVLGAIVASSLIFQQIPSEQIPLLRGVLLAGGLIVILGLIDDIQGSCPWKKLLTQFVAVLFLQFHFDVLGLGAANHVGSLAVLASLVLVFPWMLGMTNAMNLIDGLDGLASGVAAASGLGMAALATILGEPVLALVAATIVGASLGFLRSNAHPAKIIMGDTGSMFLGFGLAAVGAGLYWSRPELSTLLALLLITWVPCIDAVYAVLRRWASHASIFQGDMGHIHHRLLDAGFSQRGVGLSLCGLNVLSGLAGTQVMLANSAGLWIAAVLLATLPLVWILRIGPSPVRDHFNQIANGDDAVAVNVRVHARLTPTDDHVHEVRYADGAVVVDVGEAEVALVQQDGHIDRALDVGAGEVA